MPPLNLSTPKLGTPKLFILILNLDPKEELAPTFALNTYVIMSMTELIANFEPSMRKHPAIAPGPVTPSK